MATVELKAIDELVGMHFWVPSYQRGYRWTNVQVKELLEDLYDFAIKKKDTDEYYCLQPIIVKQQDDKWELVDGQQRLTALWLISALYYCSNKEDVLDLQREKYQLEYEEKPLFTNLFDKIDSLIEDTSLRGLSEKLESSKSESIDSGYLIESIAYIGQFQRNKKTAKGVLSQIFETFHDIRIIWYVLDPSDDSIQTFTNINANKIELTNAELIKATLLNAISKENEQKPDADMHNTALQWEEIEKGLNQDSFWNYMVQTNREKYSTRIDYLFEIFCTKHNLPKPERDRNAVFRAINEYLHKDGNTAAGLWNEIQEIYEALTDWYHEYALYHLIGLLIIVEEKKESAAVLNELFQQYAVSDKKSFRSYIVERIRNIYISSNKTTPFSKFEYDAMRNDLDDLVYPDKNKVRKLLLLYNIALLVIAENTYEKFPFELYKNGTWDIEHINPQTPKEGSIEEKKAWLNSYNKVASDQMKNEISLCLKNNCTDFDNIAEKLLESMDVPENDSVCNLVLLDASTNRGYKNDCFSEKRKKIIEVERTRNKDEKYIPIGTKWVFLKGYDHANQLIVWGADDMEEYADDIARKAFELLGGKYDAE